VVGVRRAREIFFTLSFVGVVALGACGGSDSESSDTSASDTAEQTTDTNATSDTVAEDPAVKLAEFCKSALDNQGGADISPDDDPAAIAEKLSANATALAEMASVAPDEVKADADAVAAAAGGMAEAIAGDPTLDKFNSLIEEFATSEANTASANVQTWVKDNCEAGQ
jgi:hypothetical protein